MSNSNITGVVAVLPVKDHARATAWYAKLLGREADLVPMEDIAEWQLDDNAWLQVTTESAQAGGTTVVVTVVDLQVQRDLCVKAGLSVGEIVEYPEVIKMAETSDEDGNKIVFVQDISGQG